MILKFIFGIYSSGKLENVFFSTLWSIYP